MFSIQLFFKSVTFYCALPLSGECYAGSSSSDHYDRYGEGSCFKDCIGTDFNSCYGRKFCAGKGLRNMVYRIVGRIIIGNCTNSTKLAVGSEVHAYGTSKNAPLITQNRMRTHMIFDRFTWKSQFSLQVRNPFKIVETSQRRQEKNKHLMLKITTAFSSVKRIKMRDYFSYLMRDSYMILCQTRPSRPLNNDL